MIEGDFIKNFERVTGVDMSEQMDQAMNMFKRRNNNLFEGTGNHLLDNPVRLKQTGLWVCVKCDREVVASDMFCGCGAPKGWSVNA